MSQNPQGQKNETTTPEGGKNETAKPPQTETISTKVQPVLSAPADPGKPLLELRSELTSLVSYEVVTEDQNLQKPLEAIVIAVPGYTPEAAEGKERVYARTSSSQGVTKVAARSNGVIVTFKAEPDEVLLGSLKEPAQNLASTLGFAPKNVWSGSGLTRTYE